MTVYGASKAPLHGIGPSALIPLLVSKAQRVVAVRRSSFSEGSCTLGMFVARLHKNSIWYFFVLSSSIRTWAVPVFWPCQNQLRDSSLCSPKFREIFRFVVALDVKRIFYRPFRKGEAIVAVHFGVAVLGKSIAVILYGLPIHIGDDLILGAQQRVPIHERGGL